MTRQPIQLITFDLDNTLWPVDEVIIRAERSMRAWLANAAPGFNEAFATEQLLALRAAVIEQQPQLRHDVSALRLELLNLALQRFGTPAARASALAEQAFEVFIDERHQVRYFDGVLELLEDLAAEFTLAALSNGNADVARLAINRHFSFSFSAASVGVSKPDPAMFEAALAKAGVAPEQSVHIGDHLQDDVAGASAVGMQTIWLDLNHTEQLQRADLAPGCTRRVTSIASIAQAVRDLS